MLNQHSTWHHVDFIVLLLVFVQRTCMHACMYVYRSTHIKVCFSAFLCEDVVWVIKKLQRLKQKKKTKTVSTSCGVHMKVYRIPGDYMTLVVVLLLESQLLFLSNDINVTISEDIHTRISAIHIHTYTCKTIYNYYILHV